MSTVVKKIEMQNGIGGFDSRPIGVDLENIFVGENEKLGDFTGATSAAAGKTGLVPAPAAGDEEKVLRGDGTWNTVESLNYTIDGEVGKYSTIQNAVEEGTIEIGGTTITINPNVASGLCSHAEGNMTSASGSFSHVEGIETSASGESSHAEGAFTIASGSYSHAQNEYTIAQGKDQTVIGKYNEAQGTPTSSVSSDYALIIGNGSNSIRSNALAIQWDGTIVFANGETLTPAQIIELKALLN